MIGLPVLYVAGEESPEQVRLRAERLGLGQSGILIVPETTAETLATFRAMARIQRRFGVDACRRYVVSFTRSAADVLRVRLLARLGTARLDHARGGRGLPCGPGGGPRRPR